MAVVYNMTDIWTSSGTVYTAILMNVTNTASAAGSLLQDLQIGGTSMFNVAKTGSISNIADPSTCTHVILNGFGANAFAITQTFSRTRGTSPGTNGVLTAGDIVGEILFSGNDGTGFQDASQIHSFIPLGSTPAAGVMPAGLRFRTNNSTNFVTDALVLTPPADVITSPQGAIATSSNQGFFYIGTCAGIPTGTPSTSGLYVGNVPIVIDSTKTVPYVWNGSAWISLTNRGVPVTKTADFTVATSETWLINNKTGSTCTVTLPSASSFSARQLGFMNYQAQTLVSASSNVVPSGGAGGAGTAILAATVGKWALLVSDGTNWIVMQNN